ncbi:hypothetical protein Goari_021047 [Gossypium aridum]|uniref:Uncharacterized protein n=1 Tax=Gossypium aridum TaxID=34290 RepID=A0A7J8YD60_GOSAI|nr:hypothetical protein [Gossypium aridum]
MSFTSTSLERPGSPVLKDLARATKKVKNKSIDDRVSGDVVMENGLPKVSWWDKLVGNVVGRRSKAEAVLEQELEIGEDDYMINTEGEYLEITFSERIHEWIDKRMAKTVVVLNGDEDAIESAQEIVNVQQENMDNQTGKE